MYEGLGLNAGQSLLVQGIYGAVGPIANIMYDILLYPFATSTDAGLRVASSSSSWIRSAARSP